MLLLLVHAHTTARRRQALATAAERSVSMAALVAQLLGLSGMLLAAAAAAEAQAAQVKERSMEGALHAAGPSWLAGAVPREAWAQLAQVRVAGLPWVAGHCLCCPAHASI